jgi:hypothetical protein
MAQDALGDILLVDERNDAHYPFRESFQGDFRQWEHLMRVGY